MRSVVYLIFRILTNNSVLSLLQKLCLRLLFSSPLIIMSLQHFAIKNFSLIFNFFKTKAVLCKLEIHRD